MNQHALERLADSMKKQGDSALNMTLLAALFVASPIALILLVAVIYGRSERPAPEPITPPAIANSSTTHTTPAKSDETHLRQAVDLMQQIDAQRLQQLRTADLDALSGLSPSDLALAVRHRDVQAYLLHRLIEDDQPQPYQPSFDKWGPMLKTVGLRQYDQRHEETQPIITYWWNLDPKSDTMANWLSAVVAEQNNAPVAMVFTARNLEPGNDDMNLSVHMVTIGRMAELMTEGQPVIPWLTEKMRDLVQARHGERRITMGNFRYTLWIVAGDDDTGNKTGLVQRSAFHLGVAFLP